MDVAAEFVGLKETTSQCVESVAMNGRVVLVGLGPDPIETVPPTEFVRKQVSLLGSYAFTKRSIEQRGGLAGGGTRGRRVRRGHAAGARRHYSAEIRKL